MHNFIKSPEEVKQSFVENGQSISGWAKTHGFSRNLVYSVINSGRPCKIGNSHKIAVLLGMKNGVVVKD